MASSRPKIATGSSNRASGSTGPAEAQVERDNRSEQQGDADDVEGVDQRVGVSRIAQRCDRRNLLERGKRRFDAQLGRSG
jgi:hypothetical protein